MSAPKSIDLLSTILDLIEKMGDEEAATFFGKGESFIRKLKAGNADPGLKMCQRALDHLVAHGTELPQQNVFPNPPEGRTIPEADPNTGAGVIRAGLSTKNEDRAPIPNLVTPEEASLKNIEAKPPAPALNPRSRYAFLLPTNRDIIPAVMLGILGNWKATLPEELRPVLAPFHLQQDAVIHHARNILAFRFLATGEEWSIWFDSDILAPIGNPAWFKRRAPLAKQWAEGAMARAAATQLTSHAGKHIVAGPYKDRRSDGQYLVSAGAETERVRAILTNPKGGPIDQVVPVEWVPFGCVAVHRQVFLDIMERFPELTPEKTNEETPFPFFTPITGGPIHEDVTFCHRAQMAGHQCWLDLSVRPAHIGREAFL